MYDYQQSVPSQGKWIIFGCQWLSVAWYPSRQLVWSTVDRFWMSFVRLVDMRIPFSLSYAAVPEKKLFYCSVLNVQGSFKVPGLWTTSRVHKLLIEGSLLPVFNMLINSNFQISHCTHVFMILWWKPPNLNHLSADSCQIYIFLKKSAKKEPCLENLGPNPSIYAHTLPVPPNMLLYPLQVN